MLLKDELLTSVRGIDVRVECQGCGGKGRVPGGQREYGEVVRCQFCGGSGTAPATISLEQLKKLLGGST
jgi:DnaJ-class molecular chaperone